MRKNLTLLLLAVMCILADMAYAVQPLTDLNLQVEGTAQIIKNDIAGAREAAVKNALERAIMQAAAKILSDKYEDEKFQALKSILMSKADRYIKNYRIVSENTQPSDYAATLAVVVDLSFVRDDLMAMGIYQDQGNKSNLRVSLSVKGVKKYSDFSRLKLFLQSRSKIVQSIYPCRLEWQQVHFNLVVAGDVKDLVAELEKAGKYSLETIQRNQDIVEINLQVKE